MTDQDKGSQGGGIAVERDEHGRSEAQSDQMNQGQTSGGGEQLGGGVTDADIEQSGGSSCAGGYGKDQNSQNHQGQQSQSGYGSGHEGQGDRQSRGEAFDEQQGGGRDADSVTP